MISIHNIASIAKYERKTLLRSWFFRIFAILAIVILTFFNLGMLIMNNGGTGSWDLKAISSTIPYTNLLLLNVVQAVIAIFLASDFLKRDKKLDTTEVIYMRPMTNGEYVIGKTIGNLGVFIVLNLIILAIAMVFNLSAKNVDVNYLTYLYYFLLISIPTLIYIMGLSFLLMSILKNQAITFVILLGYVAISLFYLNDKFYYLFDYMTFNIPLTYSDFVGFGNLNVILIHRGIYFFLGLGFISFSILLLKRLSHSEAVRIIALVFGISSVIAGFYMGFLHVNRFIEENDLRTEMRNLNAEWANVPVLSVTDYNIKLNHSESQISVYAKLDVENNNQHTIGKTAFSLNPGLTVTQVTQDGNPISFSSKSGLIMLDQLNLEPEEHSELVFEYSGSINEAASYLDIDDQTRHENFSNMMYKIDKRYAFLTKNFVLLTRENAWYPIPGAGYGPDNSQWFTRQFSNYTLEVNTRPDLTAISQGAREQEGDTTRFKNTNANSQISLIIGEYDRIQQDIDGLDFNIYVKKGHDYFSEFFEDIKDTIPAVVTEALQDLERTLDLYYPFDRFSLIEVPVQYFSYDRVYIGSHEQIQPEMIFFGEKGLMTRDADFYGRFEQPMNFGRRGQQEEQTPEERKIQILKNFIASFTREQGRPDFSRSRGNVSVTETKNKYYAFPLFYNYAYYIGSEQWPIMDRVFEGYKKSAISNSGATGWMRDLQGTSENEQANIALLTNSFEDLLKDPKQIQVIDNVIQLKSTSLFSIIKRKIGDEAFEDFLFYYLKGIKFRNSSIEDFNRAIASEFDIDLIPYMQDWFSSTQLPAFLIGKITAVKVLDGDEQKTMVKFRVSNTENTEGIISIVFRTGGNSRRNAGSSSSNNITKLIHLDGNQTKEVSFLLSGNIRGGTINTLVSRNMPSEIQLPLSDVENDPKAIPFEGETIVDTPVQIVEKNEIIVDNEDPGFEFTRKDESSLLRKWLLKDDGDNKTYAGFNGWRPPLKWTLTTNSSFYGAYIRSACYIRSGDGSQKAQWKIPVKEAGNYDVFAYVYSQQRDRRQGRNRNQGEFHYIIHHSDGMEKIAINVDSAEEGWNHLGSFYFPSDTAIVELTNESSGRLVVADAVKFVMQ